MNTDACSMFKKRAIKIVYPRVHMFSLDLSLLNGNMKSGSLGCSVWNFPMRIIVSASKINTVGGDLVGTHKQVELILSKFQEQENIRNKAYEVKIVAPLEIREHIGLGSTTQVCAGVIEALYEFENKKFDIDKLLFFDVGKSSACGAQLSLHPGFILEHGYRIADVGVCLHPDLYSWKEVFEKRFYSFNNCNWFLILAIPKKELSLSGRLEDNFWKQTYPESEANVLKTCYTVFQEVIPSIYEKDFPRFISAIKRITTRGSKKAEEDIQKEATKKCLTEMQEQFGFAAISSLGPTIYAFSKTEHCVLPENNADYCFIKMRLGQEKR